MFPFVFEWVWDMSHVVFMGGLQFALTAMGLGMTYALIKSVVDTISSKENDHH